MSKSASCSWYLHDARAVSASALAGFVTGFLRRLIEAAARNPVGRRDADRHVFG